MLLKNCIYCIGILLSLFSIPTLIYSIKNKDRNICKGIIRIDITYIVCLFDLFIMEDILYIETGLESLFIGLFILLAGILYLISILLNLIKNKKIQLQSKQQERIKATDIVQIMSSFILICFMIIMLCIIIPYRIFSEINWNVIFIFLFVFIVGILYIILNIINLMKYKSLQMYTKQKKAIITIIILLILPVLFLPMTILRNKYIIHNSEFVLVYNSSGNGGFGDSETFAYAIGENFCEQFDLGISSWGYNLNKFLPKNAIEITNINDIKNYKIIFNTSWEDNSILVYKDGKRICKKKNKSHYFNISFKTGFYINPNSNKKTILQKFK